VLLVTDDPRGTSSVGAAAARRSSPCAVGGSIPLTLASAPAR